MDHAEVEAYCLAKPGAWPDSPFGDGSQVAKVGAKIFCFYSRARDGSSFAITVKNTREAVAEWRERYPGHAGPAAYLHKQLWNQIVLDTAGAPDGDEVRELIDGSYDLVVASLPKAQRPR